MRSHLVPSVPIIDRVSAVALSLFAFRVDITLLTDGGQSVALYTVSVNVGCLIYHTHPLCTIVHIHAYSMHTLGNLHYIIGICSAVD